LIAPESRSVADCSGMAKAQVKNYDLVAAASARRRYQGIEIRHYRART